MEKSKKTARLTVSGFPLMQILQDVRAFKERLPPTAAGFHICVRL